LWWCGDHDFRDSGVQGGVLLNFGADLPAPTLFVIAMSEFFVKYWWLIFGGLGGGFYFFMQAWKRNEKMQMFMDRLHAEVADLWRPDRKICIARWTRTCPPCLPPACRWWRRWTRWAAPPAIRSTKCATDKIQQEVSTGTSLTAAMTNANLFPSMVLQMCAIGEESGSIDHMLGKAADFYEAEVDDMVAGMSSLMEPIIIVILGTVIGGIVVSMYLPIFKLGQVV
jgi:type IV pilus assembly protein PilC